MRRSARPARPSRRDRGSREFTRTARGKRRSGRTETISVAASICTPARSRITATLKPYGIPAKVSAYSLFPDGSTGKDGEYLSSKKDENGSAIYATRFVADVTVSREISKWTEYVLCRAGYELLSTPLEPRNERWAAKWQGRMPKPWAEPTCQPPTAAEDHPGHGQRFRWRNRSRGRGA